jgi:hypothetical protein
MLTFQEFRLIDESSDQKAVMKGKTKKGEVVALVQMPNGNYHVMIQRMHYERGKNVHKWYRISPKKNMPFQQEQEYLKTGEPDLEKAKALFKKRATGSKE